MSNSGVLPGSELRTGGLFDSREQELLRILAPAGGKWAAVIEDLGGKGTLALNPEVSFTAASVIKLPIMMTAFREARAGNLRFDDAVVLRKEDKVGGSGVLMEFHNGLALTLLDAIHMMIVVSDNTATNLVIDRVGLETVNSYLSDLGCAGCRLEAHLMRPKPNGPYNRVSAGDIARLLKSLVSGTIGNPGDCETMVSILGRQQVNHKMPRLLPREAKCAHKTGEQRSITHDVGIITGPGVRFVAVFLSDNVPDTRAGERAIGEAARWAYDVLAAGAGK